MAFDDRSLDDYVEVAERIADFRDKHPGGSLEPADPAAPYKIELLPNPWCRQCVGRRVVKTGRDWKQCRRCGGTGLRSDGEPAEDLFIVYTAAAYRTPDDPKPGIGVAWEPFPGQTPYTAQSEVMNAETSAQGRAIVAALASDSKRGVASREEIRNRAAERDGQDAWEPAPGHNRNRPAERPKKDVTRARTTGPDHERLRHGTVEATPDDRPATRAKAPADDEWTDQPANVSPIVQARSKAIIMRLQELEVTDREERLGITALLAGWPEGKTLNSTNDLSRPQSDKVMAQLADLANHDALMALVTKGEKQNA